MPRLSVKVVDVTYGGNGDTFDSFVAGEVTQITVWVQVNNSGEDSFSTSLISTFNGEVFTRSQILVSDTHLGLFLVQFVRRSHSASL